MDDLLHQACSIGSMPFDGLTLRPKDLLPLAEVARLLSATVDFLRTEFPAAGLLLHDDWHEHDGWITSSRASAWTEVAAIVASPESLYATRPGDDFVRLGIYEPSGSFYLRIWVPDEHDDPEQYPGRWGSFDVSASRQLVTRLASALAHGGMEASDAKPYFDRCSAE